MHHAEVCMYPTKPSSNYDDGTRFDMDSQKLVQKDLSKSYCAYMKNLHRSFPKFDNCLIAEEKVVLKTLS